MGAARFASSLRCFVWAAGAVYSVMSLALVAGDRLPMPSEAAQKASATKVREIFATDFAAAKSPAQKGKLAKSLADQAGATDDPADRWTLLSESLRLAMEVGDVSTGLELVDRIPQEFLVEDKASRLEALTKLSSKAPAGQIAPVGERLLSLAKELDSQGEQALSAKAISVIMGLARKSKNADLLASASKLQLAIKERQKEAKSEAAMADKLAAAPDDPDVCLEVGRYYAFKLDDWAKGLPLLARGSNADLAATARIELGATTSNVPLIGLADRWWDLSQNAESTAKVAIQSHAADLYRRSIASLDGLDKVRVEKRIAAAASGSRQAGKSSAKRTPGLILWLDASDPQSFDPHERQGGDDTKISLWRDASGGGNDARQADPRKQPVWSPDAFDGSPGVTFAGGQTLEVAMPCGGTGTILVVLRPKSVGNMRFLGCYRNQGEHVGLCLRSDGSVWAEGTTSANASAVVRSPPSAYKASRAVLLGQAWGKALSLIGSTPSTVPFVGGVDGFPGPWGIGGAYLKQQIEYYQGDLGEVMVFDRELSSAELERLASDLAAKWGCR